MVLLNPAPNVVGGDGKTYGDPRTTITGSNISFIGLDYKNTSITNITPPATWDNGFGKFIRNNQILIVRDGKTYTVTGVQK